MDDAGCNDCLVACIRHNRNDPHNRRGQIGATQPAGPAAPNGCPFGAAPTRILGSDAAKLRGRRSPGGSRVRSSLVDRPLRGGCAACAAVRRPILGLTRQNAGVTGWWVSRGGRAAVARRSRSGRAAVWHPDWWSDAANFRGPGSRPRSDATIFETSGR